MGGTRGYFWTPIGGTTRISSDGPQHLKNKAYIMINGQHGLAHKLKSGVLLGKSNQSHLSISSKLTSGTVVPNAVPARFTASIIWSSDIAEK